mmetsp:Transcript_37407/g.63671  ORF Transcript_37407/g.63671 Transcript_37407/m.63671 type:complete len:244 (-) Transcript_37407:804-1535(-)
MSIDDPVQFVGRQLRLLDGLKCRGDHAQEESGNHDGEKDGNGTSGRDAVGGDADISRGTSAADHDYVGIVHGIPRNGTDAGIVGVARVGDQVSAAEGSGGAVDAVDVGDGAVDGVYVVGVKVGGEGIVDHGLLAGLDDEAASPPEADAHHSEEGAPEEARAEAQFFALTNRRGLGLPQMILIPPRSLGLAHEGCHGGHGTQRLVGNVGGGLVGFLSQQAVVSRAALEDHVERESHDWDGDETH